MSPETIWVSTPEVQPEELQMVWSDRSVELVRISAQIAEQNRKLRRKKGNPQKKKNREFCAQVNG